MWQYRNSDEIYHHGILGMKWGVRRYQNKDGSLTPAGRKKANKLKQEYITTTGKRIYIKRSDTAQTSSKQTKSQKEVNKPKTIKDLTNEELRERTNRMNLEKNYLEASKGLKQAAPKKQVTKGEKFVNHIQTQIIIPAMTAAGKNYMTDVFNNLLKSTLPDPKSFGKNKKSSK